MTTNEAPQPKNRSFPLTVRGVINAGRELYVRNTLNPRGALFITMYGDGRQGTGFTLPPTRHPINLSARFTEETLLKSNELRQCLEAGAIALLDPDTAEAELAVPGVAQEVRFAFQQLSATNEDVKRYRQTPDTDDSDIPTAAAQRNIRSSKDIPVISGQQARTIAMESDPSVANTDDAEAKRRMARSPVRPPLPQSINAIVEMVVKQLGGEDITATEARMRVNAMADILTEDDWVYLQSNTTGQLREWAAMQLAKLRGLDEVSTT